MKANIEIVFNGYIKYDKVVLQTNSGVKWTSRKNCLGIKKIIE